MVSLRQRVNTPSQDVTRCHENVTSVSRECHRMSRECHRMSREWPNPIPSSQTLVWAKSVHSSQTFGPGKIWSPPVKFWLFSILTDLFPPFLTPPKVTECHRMSRKCHESVTECHESVTECHESVTECHGMSRECHESVTECHEMSRRRLRVSRRVSRLHSPVNA